jgi:hypothetical protein
MLQLGDPMEYYFVHGIRTSAFVWFDEYLNTGCSSVTVFVVCVYDCIHFSGFALL